MATPVPGTDRLILFFAKTLMFSPEKYHLDTVQSLRCLIYWPDLFGELGFGWFKKKNKETLNSKWHYFSKTKTTTILSIFGKGCVLHSPNCFGRNVYVCNRTAHIWHQCRKTTVLLCHICINNTGIEKNEQHLK